MYSLQRALTRNLLLNMIPFLLGLLLIVYFSMQQVLHHYILTRLQHDADSLISALNLSPEQQWQLEPSKISSVYQRVQSGHYFWIELPGQNLYSRSLFDSEFPRREPAELPASYTLSGPNHETWLIWQQRVRKQETLITLRIAENITPFQQRMLLYTAYTLLLILAMIAVWVLLQQRTLSKAFAVFEQLRLNMQQIRQQQLEDAGVEPPVEIMPLVEEIHRLVQQLNNRIERTRHAISNLAHELKRPIQLLTIQQEQQPQLTEPLQQLRAIIERELRRAKISGAQSGPLDFYATEELHNLKQIMASLYPAIAIEIAAKASKIALSLDRDDMLELMGNVLDNSCKFAKTQVRVSLEINLGGLLMLFEDDGNGLDAEQIEKIRQRGVRLDESREGHGIGLSICQDIVDSYRGRIEFSRSELGGLAVRIDMPFVFE